VAPAPLAGNTLPAYPDAARKAGRQGDVILKVHISATGEVTEVELIRGEEPFASVAIAAVRTWRYRPATVDGRPARSRVGSRSRSASVAKGVHP
jgi:TonB family protein